jgi:uncharacterized protein YndB with AHSA1/START domain
MTREVTVRRRVALPPEATFRLFTDDVDRWWRRQPRFRRWPESTLRFSSGRLEEHWQEHCRLVATVRAWVPGERLELDMDGDAVCVTFAADGDGTSVCVTQTREGGLTPFQDPIGLWWADQLARLRT